MHADKICCTAHKTWDQQHAISPECPQQILTKQRDRQRAVGSETVIGPPDRRHGRRHLALVLLFALLVLLRERLADDVGQCDCDW